MKNRLSLWIMTALATLGFAACSKSKGGSVSGGGSAQFASQRTRTQIPLDSLQAGGCLNVERLAGAYKELSPDLSLNEITTKFSLSGGVREEFRLLTAFGAFRYENRPGFERVDMDGVKQDGCRALLLTKADGTQEALRVTKAEPDFLAAEGQDGNKRSYRWLSPQRMELSMRYRAYDLPCTERTGYAEITRVLDWGNGMPDILDERSPLYVDESYVGLLAQATGRAEADFYRELPPEGGQPARRVQVSSRLQDLALGAVRPELVSCSGTAPTPPAPEPEDPEHPQPQPPAPPNPDDPIPPVEPPPEDPEDPPHDH